MTDKFDFDNLVSIAGGHTVPIKSFNVFIDNDDQRKFWNQSFVWTIKDGDTEYDVTPYLSVDSSYIVMHPDTYKKLVIASKKWRRHLNQFRTKPDNYYTWYLYAWVQEWKRDGSNQITWSKKDVNN